MGKGVDLGRRVAVLGDAAETGKGVDAVNVHGARTADTLTARAAESKRGVLLVLDLDLRCQYCLLAVHEQERRAS